MSATEDDRKRAVTLLRAAADDGLIQATEPRNQPPMVERIAVALAEERERARAQFRAILDVSPQLTSEDGSLRGYLVSLPLLGTIGLGETQ